MEVSGQFYALAALPQGKSPQYPLDRLHGTQTWSEHGNEEKNSFPSLPFPSLPFLEIELQLVTQPVAKSLYWSSYPIYIYIKLHIMVNNQNCKSAISRNFNTDAPLFMNDWILDNCLDDLQYLFHSFRIFCIDVCDRKTESVRNKFLITGKNKILEHVITFNYLLCNLLYEWEKCEYMCLKWVLTDQCHFI
jgi:hypothetical protein